MTSVRLDRFTRETGRKFDSSDTRSEIGDYSPAARAGAAGAKRLFTQETWRNLFATQLATKLFMNLPGRDSRLPNESPSATSAGAVPEVVSPAIDRPNGTPRDPWARLRSSRPDNEQHSLGRFS